MKIARLPRHPILAATPRKISLLLMRSKSSVAVAEDAFHLHRTPIATAPKTAALERTRGPSPPPSPTKPVTPPSPIFVAATNQHVGKTTVSLALMSGLKKRFHNPGFIKPVGQQSRRVTPRISVDKDVAVMRDHFHLDHLPWESMSPVLIPKGYTRNYIDGFVSQAYHKDSIQRAYNDIEKRSDVVLVEGTGHCAVGSVVGASNALVARWLNASIVLVANGGLGSTIDPLEYNKVLCDHYNVPIAGVIINRINPDPERFESCCDYIRRALEQNWGPEIPLLGCIPDNPSLMHFNLTDVQRSLKGSYFLTSFCPQEWHYATDQIDLVETGVSDFIAGLHTEKRDTLHLCDVDREDIIISFVLDYQNRKKHGLETDASCLIICGTGYYDINPHIQEFLDMMKEDPAGFPPILITPSEAFETMELIHKFTPKHTAKDQRRVNAAVNHYEPYINFDLLLERTGNKQDASSTTTGAPTRMVV